MDKLHSSTYRDFFISRAGKDAEFAVWLGKLIAAQGKTYILQDEHFGHRDFMGAMDEALKSGARIVALLSQAYLESAYCLKEATTAITGDPFNVQQQLIPFRLEPCAPGGVLANIAYTDVVTERRHGDAAVLALKILRALGFETPKLDGLPPPPADTLSAKVPILHPEIREMRGDLAPRAELLARIATAMQTGPRAVTALSNSQQVTQSIAGLGGVGKTVLAKAYAWRHRGEYEGVWWIAAETAEGRLAGLAALGTKLSPGIATVKDLKEAARRTLDLIENAHFGKPWLLIYDNVEKPADIERLTPRAGAHVLITTRWAVWDGMASMVDVGVLGREEAINFLCERAHCGERDAAGRLAEALGYLPLALDHAASFCDTRYQSEIGFDDYRENIATLIRRKPRTGHALPYPESIYGTFQFALERINKGDAARGVLPCPEAETLTGIAAMLAPETIPTALFRDGVLTKIELGEAVAALAEVSLITLAATETGDPAFHMHRLVQQVMRNQLVEQRKFDETLEQALRLIHAAYPKNGSEHENWTICRALTPHALAALGEAETLGVCNDIVASLAYNTSVYLQYRTQYGMMEPLLQRSLTVYENIYDGEYPSIATALSALARLYQTQGRYTEAETLLQRALVISEKAVGDEHPDTAAALYCTASLWQTQGRYTEAETLLQRALAIFEKTVGGEHQDTAATLYVLGRLYQARGRYAEAEPLLKHALVISEKTVGGEHRDTAATLYVLSGLY